MPKWEQAPLIDAAESAVQPKWAEAPLVSAPTISEDAASAALSDLSVLGRDTRGSVLDPVVSGITFGFGDELAGGVKAAGAALTGEDAGDAYDREVKRRRADYEAYQRRHPGVTLAGEVAGGLLTGVGAAKSGLTLMRPGQTLGTAMATGAGEGAIYGALSGAGHAEDTAAERAAGAVTGGATGAVLGAAVPAISRGVGKAVEAGQKFFSGAIKPAPGVNPSAAVSAADEFGIPLSRAQATRSVDQVRVEDQLRHAGKMQPFDAAQRTAMADAAERLQQKIAGPGQMAPTPTVAVEGLQEGLRGRAADIKRASQEAYEATANNPNILVDADAVKALPDYISTKLDADGILIDPDYQKGAASAMNFLRERIKQVPVNTEGGVAAQLQWVENVRKILNKNYPPQGPDAPALYAIKNSFDDWLDDVVDSKLTNATDAELATLKSARSLWREYRGLTSPKSRGNPLYNPQARVAKIIEKDMAPEDVANSLFGSSVVKPPRFTSEVVKTLKKTLGDDSPEWGNIRQAFWLRAVKEGEETLSPAKIIKNLGSLLDKSGESVAKALYSPVELAEMRRYLAVMRTLETPGVGKNPSGSGSRLAPYMKSLGDGIMGLIGGGASIAAGADPMTAGIMGIGASGLSRVGRALRDQSLTRHATMYPVPAAAAFSPAAKTAVRQGATVAGATGAQQAIPTWTKDRLRAILEDLQREDQEAIAP